MATPLIQRDSSLNLYSLIADENGSVQDIVQDSFTTSGSTVTGLTSTDTTHIVYDPYGNVLPGSTATASGTSITTPFGFQGMLQETAIVVGTTPFLYYDNARWYSIQTGDFLSQDPSGYSAGDSNLYRTDGNDPVNNDDPTGLMFGTSADGAYGFGGSSQETNLGLETSDDGSFTFNAGGENVSDSGSPITPDTDPFSISGVAASPAYAPVVPAADQIDSELAQFSNNLDASIESLVTDISNQPAPTTNLPSPDEIAAQQSVLADAAAHSSLAGMLFGALNPVSTTAGDVASVVNGDAFSPSNWVPSQGTISGVPNIITVNGIFTPFDKSTMGWPDQIAEQLGRNSGQYNGTAVPNDTTYKGAGDIFQILLEELGATDVPSQRLADQINAYASIPNGGDIYVFAHSQGGQVTLNALKLVDPSVASRVHVITFGSEAQIGPNHGLASVTNIVNYGDPVPFFGMLNLVKDIFEGTNSIPIGTQGAVPNFSNHGFLENYVPYINKTFLTNNPIPSRAK